MEQFIKVIQSNSNRKRLVPISNIKLVYEDTEGVKIYLNNTPSSLSYVHTKETVDEIEKLIEDKRIKNV